MSARLKPAAADQLKQPDLAGRIDGLRGMTWAYAILHHTGYSASGASKRFSPPIELDGEQPNSKLMYQYLRGERAPIRGPRGKYGFDLVEAVNKHHLANQATRWLDHPLWEVFGDPAGKFVKDYAAEEDSANEMRMMRMLGYAYSSDTPSQSENVLLDFDDFVALCCCHRIALHMGRDLFHHVEQMAIFASRVEPVFGYVQAPFLKMINDFYTY